MHLNIRIKFFLETSFILALASISLIIISRFVFPSIIKEDVQDRLISHYDYVEKDFDPSQDHTSFILYKEKGLGGFVTILDSDYKVIASTSPALSHMDSLPPIHLDKILPLQENGFSSYVFYKLQNDAPKFDPGKGNVPPPNRGGNGNDELGLPPPGTELIILLGRLSGDYFILLEKPTDMLMQGADLAFNGLLITLAISLILGLVLALVVSYGITKPIYTIKRMAEAIARLDFDYKVEINSNDEIGDLGEAISNISSELKKTMGQLQDSNTKLSKEQAKLLKLNRQLKKLSRTDVLTKLANRMELDSVIEREVYKSKDREGVFSIIMIDIDHFKEVNDTFGHLVGDLVLKDVARLLKDNSRRIDVVGRWGGEEFLIILPDTTLDGAVSLAEKLRKTIESYDFEQINQRTASFGVGEYVKGLAINTFINQVDEALYRAKKEGRNRVEVVDAISLAQ